jgi:glycosyltransferase involved in cell wall biosynthesis
LLISCIIPTRNRPEFIAQAAASVLAQSYANIELIIVNDGTTPVESISDKRVRILNSGEAGAVPARNAGVAATSGGAIAWLDDDDVWTDPAFLADCVSLLGNGADFIFGDGALVFPDGTRKPFAKDADAATLAVDNTILISSVCYRRSLHSVYGSFDEALPYYWDWDWYLRAARGGSHFARLAKPVVDIRIHANNMSGTGNSQARNDILKLFSRKHHLGEIPLKSHIDFV